MADDIKVIPMSYPIEDLEGHVINTTSHSKNWSKGLSPFYLGSCPLYDLGDGEVTYSKNFENLWQYSKVYECHIGKDGWPNEAWLHWALQGWFNPRAIRYPMGKGAKPVYSFWNGKKLTYIQARKEIYIPRYCQAVQRTEAWKTLKGAASCVPALYLRDFDGYDHKALGMSYDDVIHDPTRKMGHGFVLAMMLERSSWVEPYMEL